MKNKTFVDIIWGFGGVVGLSALCYTIYIIVTATHTPGCTDSYEQCVSSHIETSQRYYGKRWHDEETDVCDEYETVTYDCDCITYHWFWGDYKNYE